MSRLDRRSVLRLGGAAAMGLGPALLGLTSVGCSPVSGSGAASGPTTTAPVATAEVTRRDLVTTENLSGTLGFGATRSLSSAKAGTVTEVPQPGVVIDRGGQLWRVDGEPVVLFLGEVPLWRDLSTDAPANADVSVLKRNLRDLGHFTGLLFADDDMFDSATQLAVQSWQRALEVEVTGKVSAGAVVVAPNPVRVASVDAPVGSASGGGGGGGSGGGVLTVTSTEPAVVVSLDADKRAKLPLDREVSIVLPGGTAVPGKVREVARKATAADDGNGAPGGGDATPKLSVTIGITGNARELEGLDAAPVKVKITTAEARGVLAVPVGALVALREGGVAVEVVDGSAARFVAVAPGIYADGWVEVKADLREGDTVVTTR